TAGILMSADDFLRRQAAPTEQQVREMLSGHLCRCTGYTPIVAAVIDVARRSNEGESNTKETTDEMA
ncbi:MAG: 2Fe-2S iron-sulfur cluster-binding protein, partial [Burkholderiaceae bacterium]